MDISKLVERIELGEDSKTQFKENINDPSSLAEEMVAFSNAEGGEIIVGVKDNGEIQGLSAEDIRRLNNMISNVSWDHVKPPISPLTETIKLEDKKLLIISVKKGINKPYCTNKGVYITKAGADKRKMSQEELQRLFQESEKIYADETIVYGTSAKDIDEKQLNQYCENMYGERLHEIELEASKILENLYLMKNGNLTLAGLLVFGKSPQLFRPAFCIKAVSFVGNDVAGTEYRDSENISGNLMEQYKGGISFLTRNLLKKQGEQGFNTEGELEIPRIVLEELLVNAIIHRDYFINASINLFIFDDRIEIISPGKLPNSLTIEHIKKGISVVRNPILTSFASKLLPYRGIGTGIVRSLKNYSSIELINDSASERFKVVIYRENEEIIKTRLLKNLARESMKMNHYNEAESLYKQALDENKEDLEIREELSKVYQRLGKLGEAEILLRELLEIDKRNTNARIELAKVYQRTGRDMKAEEILRELLEIDKRNTNARIELSKTYQRMGKYREAVETLLKLLETDYRNMTARIELADIYQKQGLLQKAESLLMQGLEIEPKNRQVVIGLSRLYQSQGRYEEAEKILKQML